MKLTQIHRKGDTERRTAEYRGSINIGKKGYALVKIVKTKSEAQETASKIRASGYEVRIKKSPSHNDYTIWARRR